MKNLYRLEAKQDHTELNVGSTYCTTEDTTDKEYGQDWELTKEMNELGENPIYISMKDSASPDGVGIALSVDNAKELVAFLNSKIEFLES